MDKKTLKKLKEHLLADKARLEKELAAITKEDLKVSQTEMSGENAYESGEAEVGTTTFERERDDSLGWNVRDLLNKINDALYRIDQGTYGICAECNHEIPIERLQAIPYADTCIKCQSKKE